MQEHFYPRGALTGLVSLRDTHHREIVMNPSQQLGIRPHPSERRKGEETKGQPKFERRVIKGGRNKDTLDLRVWVQAGHGPRGGFQLFAAQPVLTDDPRKHSGETSNEVGVPPMPVRVGASKVDDKRTVIADARGSPMVGLAVPVTVARLDDPRGHLLHSGVPHHFGNVESPRAFGG